jgi:hypothetical protein
MWANWTLHSALAGLGPLNVVVACAVSEPYPDSMKEFCIPILCEVSIEHLNTVKISYLRRVKPCIIGMVGDGNIIVFSRYFPLK